MFWGMSSAYRSAYQHVVGTRLDELAALQEQAAPWMPRLRAIGAARLARLGAGAVGVSGAVSMMLLAAITDDETPTYAMLTSVVLMVITYLAIRMGAAFAGLVRPARVVAPPELTGHIDADLARLETESGVAQVERRLARLEALSMDLPLIAVSLLAPLSLHLLFVSLFGGFDAWAFAGWIRLSLVVVGHAHLTLAYLACRFARKLRRSGPEALATIVVHREWGMALALVVGVAALPGILLFVVPPALSALTGMVFIPVMYMLTEWRLRQERFAILAATSRDEPAPAPRVEVSYVLEEPHHALEDDADADAPGLQRALRRRRGRLRSNAASGTLSLLRAAPAIVCAATEWRAADGSA